MDDQRNELVIRIQPQQAIYAKVVVKSPGLDMHTAISELDLTYQVRDVAEDGRQVGGR